jgi:KRAB domain-containing zinc finger protein
MHMKIHKEESPTQDDSAEMKPEFLNQRERPIVTRICILCEFKTNDFTVFCDHRRRVHGFTKRFYPCDKCSHASKSYCALEVHVNSVHKGVKHPCDECDKVFCSDSSIRKHKRAIHRKIGYFCKLCEFKCSRPEILKAHMESKHEGVRHYCDKCTYSAQFKSSLAKHIIARHETNKDI